MLGGIFHKRKKIQELRAPSLQDIKRFREIYGRHADARHVETPACFERSIYKAISCQKELHSIDFRQEDVTDPQIVALAETLLDMPLVSSLDLRDNRVTDDGAKALLEVLRLQIIAAKTAPKTDPKTKKLVLPPPVPEFTRYVTNVNLKGNEISGSVLDEITQYTDILKREDKRLEIRAALNQIDRNAAGGVDEEDFKAVVKLLTGTEPSKKEVKQLMSQSSVSGDNFQNSVALENVLLAKCSSSPSKKAACPPWEALVQVRHANIGPSCLSPTSMRATDTFQTTPSSIQPSLGGGTSNQTSDVQVKSAQSLLGKVTMTTMSSSTLSSTKENAASSPSPVAPSLSSSTTSGIAPLSISIDVTDGDSPSKKVDFRPPSSPPPPLPLPQTTSPERRASSSSVASTPARSQQSFDDSSDQLGSFDSRTSTSANASVPRKSGGAPMLTRQDSNDSKRFVGPASPQSASVSPKNRDDYTTDFSSWQDDEVFGDEQIGDLLGSPASTKNTIEVESGRDQDQLRNVAPRQSGALSFRRGNSVSFNAAVCASPTSQVSESCDSPFLRAQDDLASLTSNSQNDNGGEEDSDCSQPLTIDHRQEHDVEPAVDEEEEFEESTVLDIMKDGKPRNVAKVRHSEFKRGMLLQEFPGEVPFRNLIALILSDNGLRELSLFKECRFPCTLVLDLSQNTLTKISDDELAGFPKLQVLDLSNNRLRVISGLGKLFCLKALSLCTNQLRSVINIEHLVELQILRLRSNGITVSSALRLLSLNKMLMHLDLDDNPLMEADDRQRRKVTVHILNIIPTLRTLGTVPIACHMTKDKRKVMTVDMGKSVLEHDECPSLRSIWASNACDILQIVQDPFQAPRKSSYGDDDPYGDSSTNGSSPTRQKKPSREEQRQKDELRSKFVGYRSRGKAPPSPIRPKTSPFAFGPPLPPPDRKSPKKKPLVDPKLAKEQKRRASQLSEPKYPPVDTDQLKQEQRRKSRPTFDVNMSVAERLQLVHDKSLRRASALAPHAESAPSHRPSTTVNRVNRGEHPPALVMEIRDRNASPQRSSTQHEPIVEFRVEPLPQESPRHVHESNQQLQSAPFPTSVPIEEVVTAPVADSAMERKGSSKESLFLQSLAVTDFLSHAEEEISTAVTALNVLLSMCERSPSDPKKLNEYRNSLEALDILDEHESHALYERARHHDDPQKAQTCKEAFDKLGTLKKCIKELLKKLETHAPGTPTIQAYCANLRATELRDIIDSRDSDLDAGLDSPPKDNKIFTPADERPNVPSISPTISPTTPPREVAQPSPEAVPSKSLHSRLFAGLQNEEVDIQPDTRQGQHREEAKPPVKEIDDDGEFDFLASDTSMFDDDVPVLPAADKVEEAEEPNSLPVESDISFGDTLQSDLTTETIALGEDANDAAMDTSPTAPVVIERSERLSSAASTDIAQDIQKVGADDDDDFDFDAELPLEQEDDIPSAPVDVEAADVAEGDSFPATHDQVAELDDGQDQNDWLTEEANLEHGDEQLDPPASDEVATDVNVLEANEEELDPSYENVDREEEAYAEAEEQEEAQEEVEAEEQEASLEEVVEENDEDDEEAETFGDWEKGFDPNTNHYFWFNHETGESQWVPPDGWPFEVDTPFEEDAEVEEEEEVPEDANETGEVEEQDAADEEDAPPKSSFEADDDVFADTDLPDF